MATLPRDSATAYSLEEIRFADTGQDFLPDRADQLRVADPYQLMPRPMGIALGRAELSSLATQAKRPDGSVDEHTHRRRLPRRAL